MRQDFEVSCNTTYFKLMPDRDIADFCQLALRFRLLPLKVINAWADEVLVARDEPPHWALDLSTADLPGAISALNAVPGDPTGNVSVELLVSLLRRLWTAGKLTIEQVVKAGFELSLDEKLPKPLVGGYWGVVLFCEFEEFQNGYRTEPEIRASIEEKLAPYAAYEVSLPTWTQQ